ncbi:hypothetical protein OKW76_12520 [Sphingomonas sp. S1-29]|uniref:hypothetical protein n=1 Tax=Sphingomonas sp. S1-29 TaxID=2991074 RepID=UPI00223F5127|nr:hypothetical protein [Sphingomonas sp. S1-29]UZK68853.1 hypothetical protein OKW76_12520 [Sphingomonas sp. S1-29]
MIAIGARRPETNATKKSARAAPVAAVFPDPLGADGDDDEVVITTRRAIGRVALVATETAGRFQREAVHYDPMAWMLAPRRVFDGAAAVDACLDRDACTRGILVHGLGLGLDVDRSTVDALIAEDDDERFEEHVSEYLYGNDVGGSSRTNYERTARGNRRLRLYTATLAETRDKRMVQAFHASVARSADEVRARLVGRFGPELARAAEIRPGIHPSSPLVIALVPAPIAAMIKQLGRDCSSSAARTFAVDIQQVIQA